MIKVLLLLLFPWQPPHSNVVGELRISNFENEIFVEAIMDKRYLTIALMNEADCERQDMMSVCGSEYILSSIDFKVNEQAIPLEKQAMEIQKDFVVYRYYAGKMTSGITDIYVASDYMLDYHEHSILNVIMEVHDETKNYSLHAKNKSLTYVPNQSSK